MNLLIAIFVESLGSTKSGKYFEQTKVSLQKSSSRQLIKSDSLLFDGLPEASIPEKFKVLQKQRSGKGYRWRALANSESQLHAKPPVPESSSTFELSTIAANNLKFKFISKKTR
jgi:hypothetical protein